MLGLMYWVAAATYLLLIASLARSAWGYCRKRSKSTLVSIAAAAATAAAVYLIAFWNLLPISLQFHAVCERDAGFVVKVPPRDWAISNLSRIRAVGSGDLYKSGGHTNLASGFDRGEFFGGLLAFDTRSVSTNFYGMQLNKFESFIVDPLSNQRLTSLVNYSVGPREDVRIWLVHLSCFNPPNLLLDNERNYLEIIREYSK